MGFTTRQADSHINLMLYSNSITYDYHFELITGKRLSSDFFRIYKLNHYKLLAQICLGLNNILFVTRHVYHSTERYALLQKSFQTKIVFNNPLLVS